MRHSFSLKKESSLTHIQPQPLVLHPIEMFSSRSRRKSMSDTSASTVSTVGKKRRASNGFNTETMESVNGALGSGGGGGLREDRGMLADLRHPGLNAIRFASYRTAAKLRYVQKKTNMHLVDIWNIIEAFRENGLNTLDANNGVKVSRLETLISTLYHSLNKRLPSDKQINIQTSTSVLLNWLLAAYDRDSSGRLQVFSVKVGLATLCNSKPLDKLRYIFSQISDSNGHLALTRFSEYLKEVLALPAAVFESPSFPFAESLVSRIFEGHVTKINVNDFMDVMLGEPGPECLTWLPLLHRLAASESDELWATDLIDDDFLSEFVHQTGCDGCRRESFSGLRYKCDRCYNYNLCQDCFWVGRVSPPHSLDHQVKEYMTSSPTRAIGASVRRSLRCVPDRLPSDRPRYPETPERTLDLAHIVPPSPNIGHNSIEDNLSGPPGSSADTWSSGRSFSLGGGMPDWNQLDEEHRLIAHYAACLAQQSVSPGMESVDSNSGIDAYKAQKELIQALENKNKEITKEINRISREQQEIGEGGVTNPGLVKELKALRSHRFQLESHLMSLQDSRKHLMHQLEGLMRVLKSNTNSTKSSPTSPNCTKLSAFSTTGTISSTVALQNLSNTMTSSTGSGSLNGTLSSTGALTTRSAPVTPSHMSNHYSSLDSLNTNHADFSTLGKSSGASTLKSSASETAVTDDSPEDNEGHKLRNDLLMAADSVTNAMSSLVRELNSESSDEDTNVHKNAKTKFDVNNKNFRWSRQSLNADYSNKDNMSSRLERSTSAKSQRDVQFENKKNQRSNSEKKENGGWRKV